MASYSVAKAAHPTLTTTTVDTVTLTQAWNRVEVANRSGAATLWVTTDGSTPVAAADNIEFVPPGTTLVLVDMDGSVTLKILGNANEYSVTGIPS